MKRALAALASAISFFSIVPAGSTKAAPDGFALSFLPWIGMAIGAVAGLLARALPTQAGGFMPFVLAWTTCIVLTGAIHLDGFLDCCDGVFATTSVERRLEILRDPHHGSYAIVGLAVVAVLWLSALVRLPVAELPWLLALSGGLARFTTVAMLWIFPYARRHDPSRSFSSRPNVAIVAASCAALALIAWHVAPLLLVALPIAFAFTTIVASWCARRLGGGITGDVCGALIVTTEVAVLYSLAFLPR